MLYVGVLLIILALTRSHSTESLYSNNAFLEQSIPRSPCDRNKSVLPNFEAPGKRINEVKCDEYVWEIIHRDEETQEFLECIARHSKSGEIPLSAVGGRDAVPGEFPHMGALGWRAVHGSWIFKCGSTLISPKYTLTAAHCSEAPPDPKTTSQVPYIVRFGISIKNIFDMSPDDPWITDANIVRIIIHPLYSAPSQYNDIALVEIDRELRFSSNVQPACLWNRFDTGILGSTATLTGWGVVDPATKKTSPILQAAVVDIIDSEQCNRLLQRTCSRRWCGVKDQICGGKLAGGVDACQGDSGGPLQIKIPLPPTAEGSMHYVIGVTSFGTGCARPNLPGVYTRVSSFIDWIESIVWPKYIK